jgi:Family of unknown function (DUF5706)
VTLLRRKSSHAPSQLRRSLQPGIDPNEFAWRVHTAQEIWANKADVKASILLVLEGGALFAAISANAKGALLARLEGWQHSMEMTGLGILLLAVASAANAVFPKLGRVRNLRVGASSHIIYFGHLRYREAATLKSQLESLTTDQTLEALTRQIIEVAKSNWIKYRWVQISLGMAMLAIFLIVIADIATL